MRKLSTTLALFFAAGCASTPAPAPKVVTITRPEITTLLAARSVLSGETQKLDGFYALSPACDPVGITTIKITVPPKHGHITIEQGIDYPNFPRDNIQYHCNKIKSPGNLTKYTSDLGYMGYDNATIQILTPGGDYRSVMYGIFVH